MYNIAVASNSNQRLKLKRRSHTTIALKLESLSVKTAQMSAGSAPPSLFKFAAEEPREIHTPREQELQIGLFQALRTLSGVTKRRQIFCMLYDFASCVCAGIFPKTTTALLAKWDNMKYKSNRDNADMKIKFKLSPEMMDTLRMKNLNGVNNLHPSPQQSSSPHLQSQQSLSPHLQPQQQQESQQMQTRPQPESQPTQLESQQPSSSLIATAAVVGSEMPRIPSEPALSREASAQIVTPIALSQRTIALDHVEMLRTLANSIGNTSGKWDSVHAAFKSLYPNMPLSVNALRCRLKERRATSKSLQHSEVSAQPKPRKRRETSCDSCRKRKKRCGVLAANPYFCVLLSAFHQHVSIVLARLNAASSAPLLVAASAAAPTRRRPPHPAYLSCSPLHVFNLTRSALALLLFFMIRDT